MGVETIPYVEMGLTVFLCILGFLIPKSKIIFFVQLIWLIIITSFNTDAADFIGNKQIYDSLYLGGINANNFIFKTIVDFFQSRGLDFVTFNAVMSIVATLIIAGVILKGTINHNVVLSFWFIFPFIDNVVQKRAYYALALLVLAVYVLITEKKNIKKYLLFYMLVLIANSFHSMSIYYLSLPLFLLLSKKLKISMVLLLIFAGIIFKNNIGTFVGNFLGDSNSQKVDLYFNVLSQTASLTHTLFWFVWQLIQFYLIKLISRDKQNILMDINMWGLLLVILYSFNPVFTRVFRPIMLINDIAIANSLNSDNNKIKYASRFVFIGNILFLLLSFYVFDVNMRSSLGISEMVYKIYNNNLIFNGGNW